MEYEDVPPERIIEKFSEYLQTLDPASSIFCVLDIGHIGVDNYISFYARLRDFVEAEGKDPSRIRPQDISTLETDEFVDKSTLLKRGEVYDAVKKYLPDDKQGVVFEKFDKRFSEDRWGDYIPEISVRNILIGEHLEDLVVNE
jgi:hypothetical protein